MCNKEQHFCSYNSYFFVAMIKYEYDILIVFYINFSHLVILN
ncbi:hypothetical protein HMPREF1705_04735 [Acetomicrobium hydrogeniformans ATCC BAA-1850]|uniref:Uncharacterized protein n=1 Tax=Acetomicrobium hydrogeniformans ATCC BAA-1850 TaxID=592015 RepID=A0A0T5X9B5_9BACT|nr:hypothetical protein HMPREF1705_04735 [Acetomicrobium hydrogeniformans ATCC BAA-1850]